MKVTLEQILKSLGGLNELAGIPAGKVKSVLAFDLAVALESVNSITKSYNKVLQDLRKKHTTLDQNGNDKVDEQSLVADLEEVQAREYEINFPTFAKSDVMENDKFLISIGALSSLLWLVSDHKPAGS